MGIAMDADERSALALDASAKCGASAAWAEFAISREVNASEKRRRTEAGVTLRATAAMPTPAVAATWKRSAV